MSNYTDVMTDLLEAAQKWAEVLEEVATALDKAYELTPNDMTHRESRTLGLQLGTRDYLKVGLQLGTLDYLKERLKKIDYDFGAPVALEDLVENLGENDDDWE